jgi:hypothetical protein
MSDTTTTETTAPTAEQDVLAKVKTELKAAGETGKRQWEDAFTKTREGATRFRADWTNVATRTRDVLNDVYARAEARGAALLLGVVAQVRTGAESLEKSLRERAKPVAEATPAAETAPAA